MAFYSLFMGRYLKCKETRCKNAPATLKLLPTFEFSEAQQSAEGQMLPITIFHLADNNSSVGVDRSTVSSNSRSCESLSQPSGTSAVEPLQPPHSALMRRRALVPEENKIFDDSPDEEDPTASSYAVENDINHNDNVVIIPSMRVSPGDVHLINRAITNRGDPITELQKNSSAAQNISGTPADGTKKPRRPNSWVFKRIKDWSHRAKAAEVTRHLQSALQKVNYSEYHDENLMVYLSKDWTDFLGAKSEDLTVEERKRLASVWELFQSELSFLSNHLLVLRNVYKEPLKACQVEGHLLFVEPDLLFGNLEELCQVSFGFCKELFQLLTQSLKCERFAGTEVIVKLFDKFSKRLSPIAAYQAYCINYKATLDYLESARKMDDRFQEFEKVVSQDSRCNKLQLQDLLIAPLHRITRLPLLLNEILKHTSDPSEREQISKIMEVMQESLRSIDDSIQWLHNFERLQELQTLLVWPPVSEFEPKCYIPEFLKLALSKQFCENLLAHPRRRLVHEGILCLIDQAKQTELFCFLFNDMLLLTKPRKGHARAKQKNNCDMGMFDPTNRFVVYRSPIPLDSCVFCDINSQDATSNNLKHGFVILHLTRFYQVVSVYTLKAPTADAKVLWMTKFQDSIDNYESIQLKDMLKSTTPVTSKKGVKSPELNGLLSTGQGDNFTSGRIVTISNNHSPVDSQTELIAEQSEPN